MTTQERKLRLEASYQGSQNGCFLLFMVLAGYACLGASLVWLVWSLF